MQKWKMLISVGGRIETLDSRVKRWHSINLVIILDYLFPSNLFDFIDTSQFKNCILFGLPACKLFFLLF